MPDEERPHRLAMLDRTEEAIDDWWGRTIEDQKCFDLLAAKARANPLDGAVMRSLAQRSRPTDDNSLAAILSRQGWYRSSERAA